MIFDKFKRMALSEVQSEFSDRNVRGEMEDMTADSSGAKHFFEPDDIFADYTIIEFCGRGAYGEVYLAEDISHKTVALKVIPIVGSSEIWRMELIGLRHYRQCIEDYHSLIEIYHVGETDDYFYYTMEPADNLLHGDSDEYIADTLSHRLERGGRLSPEKVLELSFAMLDALEELSSHNLVHRDLKPGNIVFVNGAAKLSDIGLIANDGIRAKLVGTADFLPPELSDGDVVGSSNDLYALGKVIYCALTGLLPDHFPEVPVSVPMLAWRALRPVLLRACSNDPRLRFFTPQEFRMALPPHIREANVFDNLFEALRLHSKQHPAIWRGSIISTVLFLSGMGFWCYLYYQHQQYLREEERNRINFIFGTIDSLGDQFVHLNRLAEATGNQPRFHQLEIVAGLAGTARAGNDLEATERYCRHADTILKVWAEEEYRKLVEKYPPDLVGKHLSIPEMFAMLTAYSNFDALPLKTYLTPASAEQFRDTENALNHQLAGRWEGPRPGESWQYDGDEDLRFVYIPGGRLEHEPPASFWISANEVTRGSYARLIPGNTHDTGSAGQPVTDMSWNDWLELCHTMTMRDKERGVLPEDLIYRLPYDDEWSFVYRSGWRGSAPFPERQALDQIAWFGGNSLYRAHPVRRKQSGPQGLFDLIGNVDELVVPRECAGAEKLKLGNYGGSFRDWRLVPEPGCFNDPDSLAEAWSGARLVLGPGTSDYFQKMWYTGSVHAVTTDGMYYEVFGGPRAVWDGESATQWSNLLGARLAILDSPAKRQSIFQQLPRLTRLGCLVGGVQKDGKWVWQDGSTVYNGDWLQNFDNSEQTGVFLVWDRAFWRGATESETVPMMMAEWPLDAWKTRSQHQAEIMRRMTQSPLLLKQFHYNGNDYWLLKAPVDWYTARRLAELLGGSLAPLTEAGAVEKVKAELANFPELRIALGVYRQYGKWCGLDGNPGPETLPADRPDRNVSLNQCFMALYREKLCNTEQFDALLCMIPAPSHE